MKLYEMPRNTRVRVVEATSPPPDGEAVLEGEVVMFHHIDGMYSYCTNEEGQVVHLKAWTEVSRVLDE